MVAQTVGLCDPNVAKRYRAILDGPFENRSNHRGLLLRTLLASLPMTLSISGHSNSTV